jgi:hypothetical protein
MSRNVWIYTGVLVALLLAAWLRWTGALSSDDEAETEAVVILRAEVDDIERITFHNDTLDVTITMKEDALGRYPWVELEERKKKPKPVEQDGLPTEDAAEGAEAPEAEDAAEGAEAPEAEDAAEDAADDPAVDAEEDREQFEIELVSSSFKGGDAVTKLLEKLAPLEAVRALGEVSPEKLADLELETPESWIEITRKGKVRKLEVGGEAYGTRDFYVHDIESGEYYLVDADVFRPLKYAKSRLPDRRLTDLEREDITGVVLQADAGRVEMIQQNAQDKDAAYWANRADPETAVELYANWLDKALRLKGLNYVQPDDAPEGLQPAFELSLLPQDGEPHSLQVFERPDTETGESDWYARSEFTRGLMELHRVLASEAAQDVRDVIDAEGDEELEEAEALELLQE